jgi:ribulose-phosphate 3-epimerase
MKAMKPMKPMKPMPVTIAPSILSADFSRLAEELDEVREAGARSIHVDVMDGHFVPNLTLGPVVVRGLRKLTPLPLDVHLMVTEPDSLIEAFVEAGADHLTVHVEAVRHLDRTLNLIRSAGKGVGVALNPATPVASIENVLEIVDLVLVMSVNPGFGGQRFIDYTENKIRQARQMIDERGCRSVVQVDGGVNADTLERVIGAGAEVLVVGAAVFHASRPGQQVRDLLEKAQSLGYHSRYA